MKFRLLPLPFLLLAMLAPNVFQGAESPVKPNIVLIMCDDMGYSDIGCFGGEIRTPNIDRLAAEGLRFTNFYNNAKCTTTRASVVTGLYARRPKLLASNMVTLAEVLQTAGYQTALSGKWHLGSKPPQRPIDRGFQEYFGLMDGCCNFFDPSIPDPPFKGRRVRVVAHNDQRIHKFPADFYMTDAISDHAAKTIKTFAGEQKPFFLHICYTAPHYPLHAKPEDIARYQGKYLEGWEELRRQRRIRQIASGLIDSKWSPPGLDPLAKPWASVKPEDRAWQDRRMAVYAAMVDCMDQGVGRVLAALKDAGVEDNTLVLFLSDNGGCSEHFGQDNPSVTPGTKDTYTCCGPDWAWAQNTPFRRYKAWVHEGGISTPLIARWPGVVEAGSLTRQVGHIIDFMPTFVELAGGKYPEQFGGQDILPTDGLSLTPILRGQQRPGTTRCVGNGPATAPCGKANGNWCGTNPFAAGNSTTWNPTARKPTTWPAANRGASSSWPPCTLAGPRTLDSAKPRRSNNAALSAHGGSYPPGCQGWQRQMRATPRSVPEMAPYFFTAPMK